VTTLPQDVDAAAKVSRTIRYQRDLVRRHVREEHGILAREMALLELAPDRATPESLGILEKLVRECPPQAVFISVDFSVAQGWRPQPSLRKGVPPERSYALSPDPLPIDGVIFDPRSHFRQWRHKEQQHISGKSAHRATILGALSECRTTASFAEKATQLDGLGLRTHGGRVWTPDNLRKFLAKDG